MKKYNFITKKFLNQNYIIEKKSSYKIAKELKVSSTTIRNYLNKFRILTRDNSENSMKYNEILTKGFLRTEYINKKKTMLQIADKVKCSTATIHLYLKKYDVPITRARIDGNRVKIKEYRCIDCNKEITKYAVRCESCGAIERLKNPKNHPNWKNGISFEPYSIEFNNELKLKIRKRDNYTCQNCGMTEEEHIIILGEVLTVHHIDYNKKNCQDNNLITLCRQCNCRANYNREYWKNKFEEKTNE